MMGGCSLLQLFFLERSRIYGVVVSLYDVVRIPVCRVRAFWAEIDRMALKSLRKNEEGEDVVKYRLRHTYMHIIQPTLVRLN